MNCRYLLSMLFVALSLSAWAERIPESTARQVAQQVLSGFNPLRATVSPVLAYQAPNSLRSDGGADYFIYTPDQGKGFVIVSGDDIAYPVLGYSTTDPFSADYMPIQMKAWLENYQNELAQAKVSAAPESVAQQWASFLSGETQLGTGRELATPLWKQSDPFNRMTPLDGDKHCLVGCVATAMGIIMGYHHYPERVVNPPATNTYSIAGISATVQIDYSEPYDWSNMLPAYSPYSYNDTQAMAVSRLLYHCGANVFMQYNGSMSGAKSHDVPKAMRDVFGYSPVIQYFSKDQMSWSAWKSLLRADIDEGTPVYYDGKDGSMGHAFVCDGYNDEFFHFNWGLGGYCNGYYLLSALTPGNSDYTSNQSAIFHIRPPKEGDEAEPVFTVMGAEYTKEGTSIRGNCNVYYAGCDEIDYKIGLGVIDGQNKIIQTPPSSSHWLHFNPFHYVGSIYTIDLNGALSSGEKVVVLGSTDGQNWKILPTAPSVPIGLDSSGVIAPPEDNTNDPEDHLYLIPLGVGYTTEQFQYIGVMDNSQTTYDHLVGMLYHLSRPATIHFHYTLLDYDQWKGKLAIFSGNGEELGQAYAGDPVTIADDGTFVVTVPENRVDWLGFYGHFLKVFSSQQGQLRYTITGVSDDYDRPVYSKTDAFIQFVDHSRTSWENTAVQGKVGEKIILKPYITELDPYFEGKDLQVDIKVRHLTLDQYDLYRSDGQPITLKTYDGEPEFAYTPERVLIWEQGKKSYDLVLVPKVAKTGDVKPVVFTTLYHKGHQVPTRSMTCSLTIYPSSTAIEDVDNQLTRIAAGSEALLIDLKQDAVVAIYTLEGRLVRTDRFSAGEHRISLPKGSYLIQVERKTYKIII